MSFSKEEKMMWLEDWSRSGKKAWTYAKENGLIPQTFCTWVKRAEGKKPSSFVEITKKVTSPVVQSQEMVIETGGLKIRMPLTTRLDELQTILAAVKGFK